MAAPELQDRLRSARAEAEGVFMGLCLIRHTLNHFLGEGLTGQLSKEEALCSMIAMRGLTACAEHAGELTSRRTEPLQGDEGASDPMTGDQPGDAELIRGSDLLRELNRVRCLNDLFKTDAGKRWLASEDERVLVETFYAKRPEETATRPQPAPAPPAVAAPKFKPTFVAGVDAPKVERTGAAPVSPAVPEEARGGLADEERRIIERAIRGAINLPADAPLGPAEMARVTELNLAGDPITDAGVAWLADPATGLKGLTSLDLDGTRVTDAGVKHLAREGTGLKGLTSLDLGGTQVTDAGVEELAREGTGLKGLTELYLYGTQVTDAGVKDLARKGTGLKGLTKLDLEDTQVTDTGMKAVEARWPGIIIIIP